VNVASASATTSPSWVTSASTTVSRLPRLRTRATASSRPGALAQVGDGEGDGHGNSRVVVGRDDRAHGDVDHGREHAAVHRPVRVEVSLVGIEGDLALADLRPTWSRKPGMSSATSGDYPVCGV
jgi:hypothetical protein